MISTFFSPLIIDSFLSYLSKIETLGHLLIPICPSNLISLKASKLHVYNVPHIYLFCYVFMATTEILALHNPSLVKLR